VHDIALGNHPGMQRIHHRYRFLLPYSATYVRLQILDFPLDLVPGRQADRTIALPDGAWLGLEDGNGVSGANFLPRQAQYQGV